MMKFLLVIAMTAQIGFSFTSAAAIDSGYNEMPESMEAYRSLLESMLRDASELITENAAIDENMDFDSFNQENIFDEEQLVSLTEEEQGEAADGELSAVEDNRFAENVDSGIRCSWRGRIGQCCQSVKVIRVGITVCLVIEISPPLHMRLSLKINGRTIWSQNAGVHQRGFNVCIRKGPIKICFKLYNVRIQRHSVRVCLGLSARLGWIRYRKSLGCIQKRYAMDEFMNEPVSSNVHKDALPASGYAHNNNVLRFKQ